MANILSTVTPPAPDPAPARPRAQSSGRDAGPFARHPRPETAEPGNDPQFARNGE